MTPAPAQLLIRAATPDDADAVGSLHVSAWRWAYRGLLPDAFLDSLVEPAWRERWRATLSRGDAARVTWLAELDGAVLGFCHTGPARDADATPAAAEVYAIYLAEEVAGRGVGRALMAHALDHLRARGSTTVTLWVLRDNLRARHFYEAAGFRLDGAEKVDTDQQGNRYDEVRYRLTL